MSSILHPCYRVRPRTRRCLHRESLRSADLGIDQLDAEQTEERESRNLQAVGVQPKQSKSAGPAGDNKRAVEVGTGDDVRQGGDIAEEEELRLQQPAPFVGLASATNNSY